MDKNLTDFQIALRGQLLVNVPIIIISLASIFVLNTLIQNFNISVLIGTLFGWFYWKFSAAKWIKWADKNNVNHERLYKIGKKGLLIWNRKYITDVIENNQKPWF
ncbi:hypothetical protein SAMN05660845_1187 [Flavobacterium swingsii]|jgi:hypothetical protein|uniref:Uncharacterized protein n=1 Tax=Flavobacterium swingsii TaxID=498292 RepID=A0A1I0XGL5_9FLAO|nr:hypothetical protein [Flavobacterium swingsii]SFA99083.1 hypothetical protein SAMN05660845_1187 [Flavobacterium swingsii]